MSAIFKISSSSGKNTRDVMVIDVYNIQPTWTLLIQCTSRLLASDSDVKVDPRTERIKCIMGV